MGQSKSQTEFIHKNEHLLDKLTYILTENSGVYGELPVYRLTEKPYDYFLRYRETYHNNQHNQEAIAQHTQLYQALENHRNIVKIDIVHIQSALDLCSNSIVFDVYARYHNYTLQNAIQCKVANKKMFRDADLFYIVMGLADVGCRMGQVLDKPYVGLFRTDRIYLSTDGFIKIYPFRLAQPSLMTQQSLEETSNGSEVQLNQTHHKPHVEGYRHSKSDIKDLAIVMAQLCLLCSKEQQQKLSKEHTRYKLQTGLSGRLSLGLRMLLLQLLQNGEMGWQQLRQRIQQIKKIEQIKQAYSIRLEQSISRHQSQIFLRQNQEVEVQREQRQKVLQSVQLNLVPSRIQLLSRRHDS